MPKVLLAKSGYYGLDKLDGKDDRSVKWKKERKELGMDETEMWSLGDTIIKFSLPRIKWMMEIEEDTNSNFEDIRQDYLDLIEGLELFVRNNGNRIWDDEETLKVEKALELFGKMLPGMWF